MTQNIELAPHVQDINRALNGKLGLEKIEHELKEYTDVYQIPLYEAKRNIVKKYDGDLSLLRRSSEEKKISEISIMDKFVDVTGLVRSINTKEATIKGELRTLFYGLLLGQDGSSISFTAWDDPRIEKGQLVKVVNSKITTWRERPQLNINGPQQVEVLEIDEHPDFKLENIRKESTISAVMAGDSFIALQGLVIDAERRERTRDDGTQSTFYSGVVGDETGILPFTSWRDDVIEEGDFIAVENAYAREWRGQPQLVFNENTVFRKPEKPENFPTADELKKPRKMTLRELEKHSGGNNVTVTGVLLDIKKNSGLIRRCPECNRVVQKGSCLFHGDADGIPDLRIKGILDDGGSSISVVLGKGLTEQLLSMSLNECQEFAIRKGDPAVVEEQIKDKLLASPLTLHGNVIRDDYGLTIIASGASATEVNVVEEAEELLRAMEGEQ